MENQFDGMTDTSFSYEEFEEIRNKLITDVNALMTDADRSFLVNFEHGKPEWDSYEFSHFKDYPSIQWKMLNLRKLAKERSDSLRVGLSL